jgi:hypothetical protein
VLYLGEYRLALFLNESLILFLFSATAQETTFKFEESFQEFINANEYKTAQVGVLFGNIFIRIDEFLK